MKCRSLKVRRWLAALAVLVLALVVVLGTFEFQLLCVTSRLKSSDAIVVLGGEPVISAEHAARLATNGLAPLIIVTGNGDCESNRRIIIRHGVPTNHVVLECASRTTQENALLTVKLLRERKCQRVILVTSWFHSRRALGSFRKYAPEIEFISVPVERTKPWRYERGYVMSEYLKTIGYVVRFGIWPAAGS
jgi:uncharacterized SAM-binding protein YcdF (DUF218 family)